MCQTFRGHRMSLAQLFDRNTDKANSKRDWSGRKNDFIDLKNKDLICFAKLIACQHLDEACKLKPALAEFLSDLVNGGRFILVVS